MSVEFLHRQGAKLFDARTMLLSLWQVCADLCYPERADFTLRRNLGQEFARNLMTSYPILARRNLGDAFGTMLRPTSLDWFHTGVQHKDMLSQPARAWLERADAVMRRAMFDRSTGFARATKEGDHDFAAFGQCVIQISLNSNASGLLYRAWHLRDCAWRENADGIVDTLYRKWKCAALDLVRLFPKTVDARTRQIAEKTPYEELEIWHVVLPSEQYEAAHKISQKWTSVYFMPAGSVVLEEVGQHDMGYIVPRWSTVSGYQYAYSPAMVAALPDARLIQSMTRVLLEAGEKAVAPPMLAVQNAIRSDMALYAGGVTWVDEAYDERLGEALRPLTQQTNGIPLGAEMLASTREAISEAFYLNKLTLPPAGAEMTAYEVGQRVQEYIRQAMPLFDPLESEYNAPLCEQTFSLLMRAGAFGSHADIPAELQGSEVLFDFESPLHDATKRAKGQRFLESMSMLGEAVNLDPSTAFILDAPTAFREVLDAIGVPADWTREQAQVQKMQAAQKQQQQTSELLANLNTGATAAKTLSDAGLGGVSTVNRQNADMNTAGVVP